MSEDTNILDGLTDLSNEMKALTEALKGDQEAQAALEKKSEGELKKMIDELNARVSALATPDAPPVSEDPLGRSDTLAEKEGKFNFAAFFNGVAHASRFGGFHNAALRGAKKGTQAWHDAMFTIEMVEKQMSTTAGSGGYIVPEEWSGDMIEKVYANMVCVAAGARQMKGLNRHTFRQPALSTGATAYWVAENGAITASTLADAQKTLQPHECAALVKASNQLLDLSNPSAASVIQDDVAKVIGLKVDLSILRGSGSSNEPTGVANTSSINTVTTSSSALTWALLEDFPYALAAQNTLEGKLAFVMNPRTVHNVKQLTTSSNPLFASIQTSAPMGAGFAGGNLVGYPVFQTTQVPITGGSGGDEAEVYFCNWDDVVLADWGPLEFAASSEADTAFAANQTWIRALWLVDVMVRKAKSCCVCTDTTS